MFSPYRKFFKYLTLFLSLSFLSCGGGGGNVASETRNIQLQSTAQQTYSYSWETALPETVGLSASAVQNALDYATFDGLYTQSAIIVKDEKIVGEKYRSISELEKNNLISAHPSLTKSFLEAKLGSQDSDSLVNSWSVGKSFTSILFGIAESKGLLSINSNASDYINEWIGDERKNITIKNLLDMRSGLHQGCFNASEPDEIGNCADLPASSSIGGGNIARATNQLIGCINQTFNVSLHGQYNPLDQNSYSLYSNCDTMILGEIFYRATSQNIKDFAQTHLFSKLDITVYWWKDNSIGGQNNGNYLTYCCIDMTARDFLKIGQLLLNDGLWNGERILSSAYVQQIKDLTTYGLKFWHTPEATFSSPNPSFNKLIFAAGFDGQYVFIDFENKILISRNSLYYPSLDLSEERKMSAGTLGSTNFTVTAPTIITTNGETRLTQVFSPTQMINFLYTQ